LEELIGDVKKIIFRNIENGWTVLRLDTKIASVMATGSLTSIHEGEYVRFLGEWTNHKTYGQQFKIERKTPHNSVDGIKRYLSSRLIKGIGTKTSTKIVDYFGVDTLDILDNHPERLSEVPSIGSKKVHSILEAWETHRRDRTVELFLLSGQLSPKLAMKIIGHYGENTMAVLTRNPYQIAIDIRGVGFLSADKFAETVGIPANSSERMQAAICHCIRAGEENGNCFLTTGDLTDSLKELLKLSDEELIAIVPPAISALNQAGYIVTTNHTESDGVRTSAHYRTPVFDKETGLAKSIMNLMRTPIESNDTKIKRWLNAKLEQDSTKLSQQQAEAISQSVRLRFFILTGGPGVGKSTTANLIIRLLNELGKEVALAAPTGRAAQRLTELTGQPAKTIHRLLDWTPGEKNFGKNQDNPLTAQAVIIDEVSMLDLNLAYSLLQAISPKSQLILIGDTDQLPSVGAGNVLSDLIQSKKVPYSKLTEVFRQAAKSDIIQLSHLLNQGKTPSFTNSIDSDCRFIEASNGEIAVSIIKKLLGEVLPNRAGYNPIKDVQVLTPMKKSDTGTENLNQVIQELLNPAKRDTHEYQNKRGKLRPGDKVIQNTNDYDLGVYNGDIGFVKSTGMSGGQIQVEFGNRDITYTPEAAENLRLAYAITIHKSQGSEFPVIIIPISGQHFIMLQRNLIYTALTRAKKLAIFVGTSSALETAVNNQTSNKRRTNLAKRLVNLGCDETMSC